MSNNPSSGRAAGNSGDRPVRFTLSDAERIAKAVSAFERGRRQSNGSALPRAAGGGGSLVTATFQGSWLRLQSAVVTLSPSASTNTARCYNAVFSLHGRGVTASRTVVMAPNPDSSRSDEYILVNAQY